INDALKSYGYDFRDKLFDAGAIAESREPFVLITSGRSTSKEQAGTLPGKRRTLAVSGWATSRGFKYFRGVDYAFALSDHADFQDLLRFVDGCNPEVVYTCHGFAKKFALLVHAHLGIDAIPLERGQHFLSNYA
ncbi:MAG TPA: MBL fold metallo-hydrolase RNA specificity domain-containing protein, partial [Candidatus Bathyarchaeia archaeon]|nr:MBL fold metallo-hydrolase RNA specificity domain-containing protein [Candidatus Bathyarchaeia archaeon]